MRFVVLIVIVTVAVVVGLGMLWITGKQQPATSTSAVVSQPVAPVAQVATVDILVARQDIPTGTTLTGDLIDRQPWPRHLVLDGFITSTTPDDTVIGMVARSDFRAREPLILSKLSPPQDATFLASSLGKGMRAVTLAVDAVSGVAGYLMPGDRVDVLMTHSVSQEAPMQLWGEERQGGSARRPTTAEILLPNLKVLAVNIRKAARQEGKSERRQDEAESPSSVTLEMTQEDSKKLRLAEKNGTLSLTLRSLEDRGDSDVGLPVTLLDISRVEGDLGDSRGWSRRKVLNMRGQPDGGRLLVGDEVVIIRGVVEEKTSSQGAPVPASGY